MQQIADWLEELGMSEYEKCFAQNRIDLAVLPESTDQHLKDLGIALGDRLKMLRAIRELSGAALAPRQPVFTEPKPQDAAERRQVTVMFSDLVGSTALSTRMDPEDLREVISAYQKSVANSVRRFGGFVAKYMGDGVIVYFGYPQAHEDDAERAVRAGLELVAAVSDLKTHTALQTRVGIATGFPEWYRQKAARSRTSGRAGREAARCASRRRRRTAADRGRCCSVRAPARRTGRRVRTPRHRAMFRERRAGWACHLLPCAPPANTHKNLVLHCRAFHRGGSGGTLMSILQERPTDGAEISRLVSANDLCGNSVRAAGDFLFLIGWRRPRRLRYVRGHLRRHRIATVAVGGVLRLSSASPDPTIVEVVSFFVVDLA